MERRPAEIESYAALEGQFVAWAQTQPALRAAVVVGSRARPGPVSAVSDLDLVVFATDRDPYVSSPAWLRALGPLWLAVRNDTGGGDPEWLALYADGFKADFVLTRTAENSSLADRLRASPYRNVYRRGVRALFNHGGALDLPVELRDRPVDPPARPGAAEFTTAVEAAWYAADRAARMLARGDVWRAKQQVDGALKQRLLQMLAWQAQARPGEPPQTWEDGRYLDDWADAEARRALPATFGAYDALDLWRALAATLALYHRLARATAGLFGYSYAAGTEAQITAWIEQLRSLAQRAG